MERDAHGVLPHTHQELPDARLGGELPDLPGLAAGLARLSCWGGCQGRRLDLTTQVLGLLMVARCCAAFQHHTAPMEHAAGTAEAAMPGGNTASPRHCAQHVEWCRDR